MMDNNPFYTRVLTHALGSNTHLMEAIPLHGGSVNNAVALRTHSGNFFLKWQTGIPSDMFEKEAEGLKLLATAKSVSVPDVLAQGVFYEKNYLLLEYVEAGPTTPRFWEKFGVFLARQHKTSIENAFGLPYDNYIGKLRQPNAKNTDWIAFFIENRLEYQLKLAMEKALVSARFVEQYRSFYHRLPELLPTEKPSLLHGDLWSGNFLTGTHNQPYFFDPAVYYGNREIELAFTQMFGGFDKRFYEAYNEAFPLQPGFQNRVDIYNIYPLMVHANMFGGMYLRGIERVLDVYA